MERTRLLFPGAEPAPDRTDAGVPAPADQTGKRGTLVLPDARPQTEQTRRGTMLLDDAQAPAAAPQPQFSRPPQAPSLAPLGAGAPSQYGQAPPAPMHAPAPHQLSPSAFGPPPVAAVPPPPFAPAPSTFPTEDPPLEGASFTASGRGHRKLCSECSRAFTNDVRFCPFDGAALNDAAGQVQRDPLVGTTVDGRFHVESLLGEGGMGSVYKVQHVTLGRRFAMKALRRDLAHDQELGARFIQEAKAAAAISNEHVVQITDFGKLPSGQPYFVMELLEGESLGDVLHREQRLPPTAAIPLLRQIAEALGAAHQAGIVHRDLKPDNVHVARGKAGGSHIKVLDFGLARVAGTSKLTRDGMVFGTPHYMAPEQAAGEPVDHRVDIYALGVLMYEVVTGRVPFEADTHMGVLTKHMYVAPQPPTQLVTDAAALGQLGQLEPVVLRCLEKKAAARYATMSDVVADLDAVAAALPGEAAALLPRSRRAKAPFALEAELAAAQRDSHASLPLAKRGNTALVAFVVGLLLVIGVLAVSTVVLVASRWDAGEASAAPSVSTPLGAATSAASPVAPLASQATAANSSASSPSAASAVSAPAAATAPKLVPIQRPAAGARPESKPEPKPDGKATAAPTETKPPEPAPAKRPSGPEELVNPWGN